MNIMSMSVKTQTQVPQLRLFAARKSAGAYAIRDVLSRCGIPFESVELASDEQARQEAQVSGLHDERLPVCVFSDGTRIERPTVRQILEKLGRLRDPSQSQYDLCIFGAGPAGLSAAVYAASEGLKTVVVERLTIGGQAGSSPKIENYLGFPDGISGAELARHAHEQAERFGAEILLLRESVGAEFLPGTGIGYLEDGTRIVTRASLCATGIDYRRLGLPNEDQLSGAGVFYGAGASEAELCAGDHVLVVGGGNSAGQAALHFAAYAAKVSMIVRGESLKSTLSSYLIDRISSCPRIEVLLHTEVSALHGDDSLTAVTLRDKHTGAEWTVQTSHLFLCLGGEPHTKWAAEVGILRDDGGYLLTGPDLLKEGKPPAGWALNRAPYHLETNVPGVFAAGDVRHGSIKRCAAAVGEGAMAVSLVHRYLAGG
jgi:thioredoxin reductase (NADPH)